MRKSIFNAGTYPAHVDFALLLLRVFVGVFMLTHGVGKMQTLFSGAPIQFADPLGVGASASLALTVFAEVICSVLLIVGLLTRWAAIPLLITMLVAAFVIHANDGFAKQEFALLYGLIYMTLVFTGAGKYSLDYFISKK